MLFFFVLSFLSFCDFFFSPQFKDLPPTLIIQIKRFEFDFEVLQLKKLNNRCSFPFDLDMERFTAEVWKEERREKKRKEEEKRKEKEKERNGQEKKEQRRCLTIKKKLNNRCSF